MNTVLSHLKLTPLFLCLIFFASVVAPVHVIQGEQPTDIILSNNSIAENQSVNTVIGTLSATSGSGEGSFNFTLPFPSVQFNILGDQLRSSVSFDYETLASYMLTIRADDGLGNYLEKDFTIFITDVNEPPLVTDVTIKPADNRIGILNTGDFKFTDPDGDDEGSHQYQWYRANDASGSGAVAISGATAVTYRPVKTDGSKYICFEITPRDEHNMAGTPVRSPYKYINAAPVAANAQVYNTGTLPGQTVRGRFTYSDLESDTRGNAQYVWFRSNNPAPTPASPGTNLNNADSTYVLKGSDANRYIWYKVKPVALSGSSPGDSVWSNVIGPIGEFQAGITGNDTLCTGTIFPITLTISGGNQPYTATLTRTLSTLNGDTVITGITASPRIINVKIPGNYVLKSLVDKDSDGASVSATPVQLRYYPRTKGTLSGSAQICNDGVSTANLTLNFTAGTAPWTFTLSRYRPNGSLHSDTVYTNVTADPFVFPASILPTYESSRFRIKSLSDKYLCAGDTSGTGTVTLSYKLSPRAELSGLDTLCPGDTAILQVALEGSAPWSITYLRNGAGPHMISNITDHNYELALIQEGTYTLSRVEDAVCTGKVSGSGIVRAYSLPTATITGTATICENTTAALSVALTGSSPWGFTYHRNAEAPVAVPNVLTSPNTFQVSQGGTYTLIEVFDKHCKGTVSGSAVITITPAPVVSQSGLAPAYNHLQTTRVPLTGSPTGGSFTGPGISLIPPSNWGFTPNWAPIGTHNIVYSYRSPTTQCWGYDTTVVRVLEASATIEFERNRTKWCRNDRPFIITGVNVANDTGSFTISGGIGLVDHLNNTATVNPSLLNTGSYTISYTYFDGTLLTKTATLDVGLPPTANFSWATECFHAGQSIRFSSTSTSTFGNLTDTSYYWKVLKPTGFDSYTTPVIAHIFPQSGYHTLELQIENTYGCTDTVTKVFNLRPTFQLAENNYFEDFEDSPIEWRSGTAPAPLTNSWRLGDPTKGFSGAYSGEKCWYTYINSIPAPQEQSWVTGPCFDFTAAEKPMLKMRIWRLFNSNRDGANIQASADSGKTWMVLGIIGDGVNWFNSYNIVGQPGGSSIGWSNDNLISNDAYWVEARHSLDAFIGKTNVQFRVAYGSNLNAQGNNGIAFDDFWILKRNRMALLEHFTNSSDEASEAANFQLNNLVNGNNSSLVDLQYHTSFPGSDPFNQHNPTISSARGFYYGLFQVPFTVLNGGVTNAHKFDYDSKPLDANATIVESLRDSKFWINLNSTTEGNVLHTEAQVTALEDIPTSDLTVHLVVIEQVITGVTGENGETSFESVVKAMLPDAAGVTVYDDWNQGDSRFYYGAWDMQHVYSSQNLRLVAFVQNEATGEVYQAAIDTIGSFHSDVPNISAHHFVIYPNPADAEVTILLKEQIPDHAVARLFNSTGRLITEREIAAGALREVMPLEEYPQGLYIIRLFDREGKILGSVKITLIR